MKRLILSFLIIFLITSFIFSSSSPGARQASANRRRGAAPVPLSAGQSRQNNTSSPPSSAAPASGEAAPGSPDTGDLFTNFDPNAVNENERHGLKLQDIIKRILSVSPQVEASRALEDVYRAKIGQIKAERVPVISFDVAMMPLPSYRPADPQTGQAYTEWTDKLNLRQWGLGGRFSMTLSMPIYTFGRINRGLRAARNGLSAQRVATEDTRETLVMQIKKYYFGYLLGVSLRDFVLKPVLKRLTTALEKTETRYKEGKVKKVDLYRIKIMYVQTRALENILNQKIENATTAFRTFLSLRQNDEFKLKEFIIDKSDILIRPFKHYLNVALHNNTTYRKAVYGLAARKAYLNYMNATYNPIMYFGITVAWQGRLTRNIDITGYQANSVLTPFLGAGISWKLDFAKRKHLVAESDAQYRHIKEQVKMLKLMLPVQIKEAYNRFKSANTVLKFKSEAFLNGKKWMLHTYKMFMLGTASASELTEGLSQYAQTRKDYFEALHEYNIAAANLSKIIGKDISGLRY
jgi:outer membrane protein TolC